jgi:hypothetical protein
MAQDPLKTRAYQLNFKKATEGLTPEEEKELARLRQQIAMNSMTNKD